MGKVVGIDLGTTNSVVAVMEGGKPVVIANAEGMRTTPSVVAFSKDEEQLVGQMARRQAVLNPQNTFYGVKRFIGRRYSELSPESKRVPYTIRKDENGNVKIKCPRLQKEFAPEEISAMVLRKLADEATRYLGEPVTSAVITVPAYFNDSQRQATRDAGRIAGLEVMRVLNEPTAASLAYGLDRRESQTVLVFDLGGGTFDVSILDVGDGVFEVKATSGDTQLGGADFDKKIVDWLADQFLEQEGVDLRRDRQSLQRIMEAAEKAKIELSGVSVTEINLPFITATEDGPKHLETRLTRSQFEGLCADLVSRLRAPVKQALNDAGLGPMQIDEVVLVGGGTRMPMVKQLVRSLVDLEPNENVNPDEVVAIGAAIQAGILTQEVRDILLLDVTPLSVGLETIGGVMKKLIPRNTTIPVRRSDIFSTSENNQTMVEVHVVQGEREMAADNKSLGRFKLMGIPPAPRGVPQVLVSFDIDANGILQVTALDKTTGREQGITVQGASTLSESEVRRMIQDAEKFAQQDRERRERVEKRTRSEALTYQAERQLREVALDFGMQFASNYRRKIENLIQELRDALNRNDERTIDVVEADLRDALYELQREVYQFNKEEEEENDFFGSIKRTLFGDDEDELPFRDSWDSRDSWDRSYSSRQPYYDNRSGYDDRSYGRSGAGYDNRPSYSDRPSYNNRSGYDDRGYDDRGYDNRSGYNDRSERDDRRGDRSYDDRAGYGDRSYDRGGNNRDYNERGYNDRGYNDRGGYDDRSKANNRGYDNRPGRYDDDWDDDDDWL
jgi:molecular chaperone DnaK